MREEAINLNNQGVTHFFKQEWDLAHECYQKAMALDDQNPAIWNNMGLLSHQQKKYPLACAHFRQANELRQTPVYLVNEANSLAMMGNFKEAESRYLEALELDSNHEAGLASLAKLYTHQSRLEKAISVYQKLINRSNEPTYSFELALVLIQMGNLGEALALLYPLGEKQASTACWFQIGRAEYLSQNYGLADAAFRRALAENPDDKASRNFYAVNLLAMNRVGEALKQYIFLAKFFPEDHEILTDLAVVLCSLERFKEATGYLKKALELKPDYQKAFAYLQKIEAMEKN